MCLFEVFEIVAFKIAKNENGIPKVKFSLSKLTIIVIIINMYNNKFVFKGYHVN